jgi:hypothetical protein
LPWKGEVLERFGGEKKGRRRGEKERRRREIFLQLRERKKIGIMPYLVPLPNKYPFLCIYHFALALDVFNTTPIFYPY